MDRAATARERSYDSFAPADARPAPREIVLDELAAAIVDQPKAVESLRATVAWSEGLPGANVLLSDRALDDFDAGALPRSLVADEAFYPVLGAWLGRETDGAVARAEQAATRH